MSAATEFRHVSVEFGCEEENCSPETVPEHWTRNRHVCEEYVVQVRHRFESAWTTWSDRDFVTGENAEERGRVLLHVWRESRRHRSDVEFRLIKRTDWLVEQ